MKTGLELLADERARQIAKGFDANHDDEHETGEILTAASQIIYNAEGGTHSTDPEVVNDPDATWMDRLAAHVQKKYADDKIGGLVIGAALLVAEIERLQRESANAH